MAKWALLILVLALLGGCADIPPPAQQFSSYQKEQDSLTPLDLAELPPPKKVVVDGQPMYAFTADEFADIDAWTEGQTKIANQLILENHHLINAGVVADQRLTNRVEELNQERHEHTVDVWFYRVALIVVSIAAF